MTTDEDQGCAALVRYYYEGLITKNELVCRALKMADRQGALDVATHFPAEHLVELEEWVDFLKEPGTRVDSTTGESYVPSRVRMTELLALVRERLARNR